MSRSRFRIVAGLLIGALATASSFAQDLQASDQVAVAQESALAALNGEWIYVEDQTPNRTLEQMSPPMGSRFSLRTEVGAVILVSGHGGLRRDVRVSLDGSMTEIPGANEGELARYRGAWKDGAFSYEIDFIREAGGSPEGLIRREFRITTDGLIVRSNLGSPTEYTMTGLYRHAQDIEMPPLARASISDIAWLTGNWSGTRGSTGQIAFEERWSPPSGGAMLAVSRTVSQNRMSAFEFLRVIERDGGLVYIAQPNGAPPTEFLLTEFSPTRAVFANPRHDYPKRIVYDLSRDGVLNVTIGFMVGGTPRQFVFRKASE
ncbi:MAG: hypothetical protein KF812_05695 [Fimbriimonadaceae bacterium]|nr:hypothetical protein [Fimbriimonadaceae bacterium]